MLACYSKTDNDALPIIIITFADYDKWLATQTTYIQAWLASNPLIVPNDCCQIRLLPNATGKIHAVLCILTDYSSIWDTGSLPLSLPYHHYTFSFPLLADEKNQQHWYTQYAITWGLGAYQFTRYKKAKRLPAQLVLPSFCQAEVSNIVSALYDVRNWINTPADDMGPSELASVVKTLAHEHQATFNEIVGEALLKQNYASIYTVGRASDDAPRLLELRWGEKTHPKLTLIGKGVCFDSGGLDIKTSPHMLLMKKDMAGAAHVLALAKMIMSANLPINLRVLIPAVENVISGNAYRPGDIIKSRKGLTVEIGNTDAEGRVVLSDALTEAVSESPNLIIDITTLTGAARIALGTDLPALFSNNDAIAEGVIAEGKKQQDVMWRMPLYAPYREYLTSGIADINNNASQPYGGAITAALFLKEFVPDTIPWLHFDLMAWNLANRPGRPQGGEGMVLRALFAYLKKWNSADNKQIQY